MSHVHIIRAEPHHLEAFGRELTVADDEEAQRCGCANACTAFRLLFEQSLEAFAAVLDGDRVMAMLGVRPRASDDGVQLWFHSTELVKRYPLAFMLPARKVFDGLLERHQVLHGMVDPKNEAMIRLTTWLGFQLDAVQQVGPFEFHPAIARREHHG